MLSADDPTPRRSALRDSIPDPDPNAPPPEVLAALAPLPTGGPWEGGTTDLQGRRWTHQPWKGWQLTPGPSPCTVDRGRVYTSAAVRRIRRRARWARWARRTAPTITAALAGLAAILAGLAGLGGLAGLAALVAVLAVVLPR